MPDTIGLNNEEEKDNWIDTKHGEVPSLVNWQDTPWYHFTHDQNFVVRPDPGYGNLRASFLKADGTTEIQDLIEVEWENAAHMVDQWGDNWEWGAMPDYVWPSARDRVWVEGNWIFDCGHPGRDEEVDRALVRYRTEIHPPQAVVTFRLNHTSGEFINGDATGLFSAPDLPLTGSAWIPVTEADIFVSGWGGMMGYCGPYDDLGYDGFFLNSCIITSRSFPVNDRNFVFEIYPPGTDFNPTSKMADGTFPVTPLTRDGSYKDVSLQWRVIDRNTEIPPRTCLGGLQNCHRVEPIIIPVDDRTPAPAPNIDDGGAVVPTDHPTRLRVILPFKGTDGDVSAKTILLGWDDVPSPPCSDSAATSAERTLCASLRTFDVKLHQLDVIKNGESFIQGDAEWHVFADVGGHWRYMSDKNSFDRNSDGDNVCVGDELTDVGDDDCFRFDSWPWRVRVQDGVPIHIAFNGWNSNEIDTECCRDSDFGCSLPSAFFDFFDLLTANWFNNGDIGSFDFDLDPTGNYRAAVSNSWGTAQQEDSLVFKTQETSDSEIQYRLSFTVQEIPAPPPLTSELLIGYPQYVNGTTTYVTSATPLTITPGGTVGNSEALGAQYRWHRVGTPLPNFGSINPGLPSPNQEAFVPLHWLRTGFSQTNSSLNTFMTGIDGDYTLQFSAQKAAITPEGEYIRVIDTEPRHTVGLKMDSTPPAITVTQPTASQYVHNATLVLNYLADDGGGSGVQSVTATMDSASTLAGHGLASGQSINLLTELPLGQHTFVVTATDNVNLSATKSIIFTIIVTAQSIKNDVSQFVAAKKITQDEGGSLQSKLDSAAKARAKGNCANAKTIYLSFISEVQAQSGKKIDPAAANILIADAQYLITHCP